MKLRRPRRTVALVIAVVLLLMAPVAVGWFYASFLRDGLLLPDHSPRDLDLQVVRLDGDRITLAPREAERVDGLDSAETWGLMTESGYGRLGPVLSRDGAEVTRAFSLATGTIEPGDFARLDSFTYRGDPLMARDIPFENVMLPSALGEMPAWQTQGEQSTWVIFVHGWRSNREEAMRILPTVHRLGLPALLITYGNDKGAPASGDGLIRWGGVEWHDLEAAVLHARDQGAESVILYGYSMGGGIVMRFLQQSAHTDLVRGAVLDAPVLDFDALINFHAAKRNIPGPVASLGMFFADQRFDLDRQSMDHLSDLKRLDAPILLFHGDNDDQAPLATSEKLARERADLVEYHLTPGAGHVRAWNIDPARYEQTVEAFLRRVVE